MIPKTERRFSDKIMRENKLPSVFTPPGPMHYVSLLIEFLRGRPAVVFWTVALTQAALWTFIPALFYSAPPGEVPMLLAIGHEFVLGSYLGPPLAFWLGEIAFRIAGAFGLYALAQACIVLDGGPARCRFPACPFVVTEPAPSAGLPGKAS